MARRNGLAGMGLYYRGLDSRKVRSTVARAKDHKLSFVALETAWQQPKTCNSPLILTTGNKPDTLVAYAEAFLAAGIHVYLWGYPWCGAESAFLERFNVIVRRVPAVSGFIPDPELGSKWLGHDAIKDRLRRPGRGVAQKSSALMRAGEALPGQRPGAPTPTAAVQHAELILGGLAALATLDTRAPRDIIVTSYGRPRFHTNFPWETWLQFQYEGLTIINSPQLYTATATELNSGVAEWDALSLTAHGKLCPSFATFGERAGTKLFAQLCAFVESDDDVEALLGWSEQQTSSDEWLQIARFAEWLTAGRCAGL